MIDFLAGKMYQCLHMTIFLQVKKPLTTWQPETVTSSSPTASSSIEVSSIAFLVPAASSVSVVLAASSLPEASSVLAASCCAAPQNKESHIYRNH